MSALVIGGNVVAALLHPLVLGGLALPLISGYPPWHNDDRFVVALYVINLLVGYLGSGVLGYIGLVRRHLERTTWVLCLIPLHWLLLSLAHGALSGSSALLRICGKKTEHGRARHSRRNQRMMAALVAMEGELSRLKREGALPPARRG